jgi:hypothetical protein
MFGRMLGYLSGLWLNLRPDDERGSRFHVGAAVVNLTGEGSASRSLDWPEAGLSTNLLVRERNLEHESAEELLASLEAGKWSRCMLPWVSLMAGSERPEVVDRWKAVAETEPNRRRRAEFGGIALLFAARAGRKELWESKLEGWNVEESEVVNEWIAIGEKRGETRGRVEGRVEGQATSLLDVLSERFGVVPEELEASIRDTGDVGRLRTWIRLATTAPDMQVFRQRAGV